MNNLLTPVLLAALREQWPSSITCDFTPSLLGVSPLRAPEVKDDWAAVFSRLETRNKQAMSRKGLEYFPVLGEARLRIVSDTLSRIASISYNTTYSVPSTRANKGHDSRSASTSILGWIEASRLEKKNECSRFISSKGKQNLFVVANWFPGNFMHFMHDTLPLVYWIKKFHSSGNASFVLIDHPLHRNFVNWLDRDLNVEWVKLFETVCIARGSGSLTAVQMISVGPTAPNDKTANSFNIDATPWDVDNAALSTNFFHEVQRLHPSSHIKARRSIIFYSRRASASVHHGRSMNAEHEEWLLSIIRSAMMRHGRSEELIIFNGIAKDGNQIGFEEQFMLFRSASMLIGPHGGGMTNLVWMAAAHSCRDRPIIIEFICGRDSPNVVPRGCGPGRPSFMSTWQSWGGAPWVNYHHLLLASNSSGKTGELFIDGKELDKSLDEVWRS